MPGASAAGRLYTNGLSNERKLSNRDGLSLVAPSGPPCACFMPSKSDAGKSGMKRSWQTADSIATRKARHRSADSSSMM